MLAHLMKSCCPVGLDKAFRIVYGVPRHKSKAISSRMLETAERITACVLNSKLCTREMLEILWSMNDGVTRNRSIHPGHRFSRDDIHPISPASHRLIDRSTNEVNNKPTECALTLTLIPVLCQVNH